MDSGAVFHSILSPAWLARLIQVEYDLPLPVECFLFRSGVNDIYQAVANGNKYMLRVTRVERAGPVNLSDCRFELELTDWLHAQGVPVVPALRRKNGDSLGIIAAPEGTRYYALFPFIEGEVLGWPDHQQAQLLGETLARLHGAADAFVPAHARAPLDEAFLIDAPMRRLRQFPGVPVAALETLEGISQSLRQGIRRVPLTGGAFGIIHGDFWWKNAIFADGKPVIIDFDFSGWGYRAYDVALLTGTARLFGRPLPADVVDAYMRGYQSLRELDPMELAAIPMFEKIRMLWACGLWATHANVFGSQWFLENFQGALANLSTYAGEGPLH